jgi:hypothetical protein
MAPAFTSHSRHVCHDAQEVESAGPFGNFLVYSPLSCNRAMVKKFVEQSGGTYTPVQANSTNSNNRNASTANANTAVVDAGRHVAASAAVVTVFGWLLLAIAL